MILDLAARPTVLFNPADKKHREYYADFLKKGSWGYCPVRFEVEGEQQNNNLAMAMMRMLTEYYVLKEFKDKPKLVRQIKAKSVDKTTVWVYNCL